MKEHLNFFEVPDIPVNKPVEYSSPFHFHCLSSMITVVQILQLNGIAILSLEVSHAFYEINYVYSGQGILHIENQSDIPLDAGVVFFISSNIKHSITSNIDNPLTLYSVSFRLSDCITQDDVPALAIKDEQKMFHFLQSNPYLYAKNCLELESYLLDSFACLQAEKPGSLSRFKNMITGFLITAIQSLTEDHSRHLPQTYVWDTSINARGLLVYIREHYMEPISLKDVAEALNYSPRQCQRLISDYLGVSFSQYLLMYRINYAKKLLQTTQAPLEEIAEKSGFKSGKLMCQQFKSVVGETPTEYRQRNS